MFQDPRKINDFSQYAPHKKDLDAFYGLPKEIIFCKQCGRMSHCLTALSFR